MNTGIRLGLSKWLRVALVISIVLLAVLFATIFELENFQEFLERNIFLGLSISLLLYILFGIAFIPAEPVTILLLAWQGPVIAILMSTLGNTLRGMLEFSFGQNIGDLADFERKKERLPFNLGKLPVSSPIFLIFARIIPGFGPKIVNIAGGVYQISKIKYLWTSILANFVGAAVVVLAAMGVITLFK